MLLAMLRREAGGGGNRAVKFALVGVEEEGVLMRWYIYDAGKKPSTRLKRSRKSLRDALCWLHFIGPIVLVKSASILTSYTAAATK